MINKEKIEAAACEYAKSEFYYYDIHASTAGFKSGINWLQETVWHDATKDKEPQGVSSNRGVLVIGIRNGRVDYRFLWTDLGDCYKDLDILVGQVPKLYSHVLWAYVRDLVPFNLLQEKL